MQIEGTSNTTTTSAILGKELRMTPYIYIASFLVIFETAHATVNTTNPVNALHDSVVLTKSRMNEQVPNPYFHKVGEEFHETHEAHNHTCLPNAMFARAITGETIWTGCVGEHPD